MKVIKKILFVFLLVAIVVYVYVTAHKYGNAIKKEQTRNDLLQAKIYSIQNSTANIRIINLTEKEKQSIRDDYEFQIESYKKHIENLQARIDDFTLIRTKVFQGNTTSYLRIKEEPKENIGKSCLPF
jgi:Tfp pilus assembly protein PilN